jgi:hypothetical protein
MIDVGAGFVKAITSNYKNFGVKDWGIQEE